MGAREVFRTTGFSPATAAALLGLHLVGAVFESAGLVMLLPIFELIRSGQDAATLAQDSLMWATLLAAYDTVGLAVTVPILLASSFVAILARQAFVFFRLCYTSHVEFALIRDLRDRAFHSFLNTGLGRAENAAFGRTVNDLTEETRIAASVPLTYVKAAGLGIVTAVYAGVMFSISPPMATAAIATVGAVALALAGILRRGRRLGKEMVQANGDLLLFLTERLKALRLIRLSATEAAELGEMRRRSDRQYERFARSARLRAGASVIAEPIMVAAALIFLYLGATHFGLTIEQIGVFLLIVIRLVPVAAEMARTYYTLVNEVSSVESIKHRLETLDSAKECHSGSRSLWRLSEGIRFERVTFRYDGAREDALRGIDLHIPAGRITALVGPSGAGKSTLIDLLPRLREPREGRIAFDGVPARTFSLEGLRAGVSYAPQSPQFFNVPVIEHIRYGRPQASLAEVERAASLAGAQAFIEALPEGYGTEIGENGTLLSGGQRQRLDLARALLTDSAVLILDEPTSQLDGESEQEFRRALARIHAQTNRTVILVGHKLSNAGLAEKIVVLQSGKVADSGTHAELMRRGGWYANHAVRG